MLKEFIKSAGRMLFRARGHFPATIMGHRYKLDPYHFAFWRAAAKGRWETTTFEIISKYLKPNSTYIDVGAWIGPTVLHASQQCNRVYCFEPDPTALRFLNWNLDLNDIHNVSSFGVALAAESGIFQMATFGDSPGDSQTSLLQKDAEHFVHVLAISWSEFASRADLGNVDLIKIDVEGAEFDLIPTMVDYLEEAQPTLLLSTHAPYLDKGERQKAMVKLRKALSFYPKVYDEMLNPIHPKELTTEQASELFGTYLFTFD